jgi:hypothetical protein
MIPQLVPRTELDQGRGRAARQLAGEPRMQLLTLGGQDGGVDRLRQRRVAEVEPGHAPA